MSTVMFRTLSSNDEAVSANGSLTTRLADHNDQEVFATAAGLGWSSAGDFAEVVTSMSRIMFAARGYVSFLVEEESRVIATGGLAVHGGVALFAGASTIPEARGRGAQKALLGARLRYARSVGCDLAMLVTEPGSGSQRNGERSGFQIAYTRTKWQLDVGDRPKNVP
jgi:GNAT superfamily N-acetyltransferase